MNKKLLILALMIPLCLAGQKVSGPHRAIFASTAPPSVNSTYAYGYASGGANPLTSTNTVSVASGDLVFVICTASAVDSGLTFAGSSTPSNTWHQLSQYGLNATTRRVTIAWSIITTGSSTMSFSCTPTTGSVTDMSLMAVDVSCSSCSSSATPIGVGGGSVYAGGYLPSPAFSPSGRTINLLCASQNNAGTRTWSSGSVTGGYTMTLVSIGNGTPLTSGSWAACDIYVSTSALAASSVATIGFSTNANSGVALVAFPY